MHVLKSFFLISLLSTSLSIQAQTPLLGTLKKHVSYFNSIDSEYAVNLVPNNQSVEWLSANIPLFECPDTIIESIYYYRWWAIRKHLKQTPDGYVFTEFITPVKHAGKYNTVSSALGHHINELRWLRNSSYLNGYMDFWMDAMPTYGKSHLHNFSSWLQYAVYQRYLVDHDVSRVSNHLEFLVKDYKTWEAEKQLPSGLFWQFDVRDAMEESISGGRKELNRRPTINSYMYGNAFALSRMATISNNAEIAALFANKADVLKKLVIDSLWDDTESFFKVRHASGALEDAREALGYIPWYFNLPPNEKKYATQWDELTDTLGFTSKWGINTAERRAPGFRTHGSGHGCEWDGAVWPFATTQTLKGLSNLLHHYSNHGKMNKQIFYDQLYTYAWSHQKYGKPYLGEYLDGRTGEWLKGDNPRSAYYNHSGFADLIISDLIGLNPREDDMLEISPLISEKQWPWFKIEHIMYHGRDLTIQWARTSNRYGQKGFVVFLDGKQIYSGKKLAHINIKMPS